MTAPPPDRRPTSLERLAADMTERQSHRNEAERLLLGCYDARGGVITGPDTDTHIALAHVHALLAAPVRRDLS